MNTQRVVERCVGRGRWHQQARCLLATFGFLILTGCQPSPPASHPAEPLAKKEVLNRFSEVEILQVVTGESSDDSVWFHTRVLPTPVTMLPRETGVWESRMLFQKVDGELVLVEMRGLKHLRRARAEDYLK